MRAGFYGIGPSPAGFNDFKKLCSSSSFLLSTTNNNNKYNNHLPPTKEAQERVDKLTGLYYDLPYGANVSLAKGGEERLLIFSMSQMFLLHVIIYHFNYNSYNFLMLFTTSYMYSCLGMAICFKY